MISVCAAGISELGYNPILVFNVLNVRMTGFLVSRHWIRGNVRGLLEDLFARGTVSNGLVLALRRAIVPSGRRSDSGAGAVLQRRRGR